MKQYDTEGLLAEIEYLRGKNREHFDACLGCDEQLKEVQKQRNELLDTLKLAWQHLWEINDSLLILKRIDKVIDRVEKGNA